MSTLFSSTDFKNELICAAYNAKINKLAQLLQMSANRIRKSRKTPIYDSNDY